MKKLLLIATTFLLILAVLVGCSKPQAEQPVDTKPSGSAATPSTEPSTKPATETTSAATADTEYEGDAASYYIDVVYAQQIERYYTAISQRWDESTYFDHDMCLLVARYYDACIRDCFNTEGWPETTLWEYVPNNS